MLEGLQVSVPVEVLARRLLVCQVLLGLSQLSQQSELSVQISDECLSLVVMYRYALLNLLDLLELLDPLVRQVLTRLWPFNEHILQVLDVILPILLSIGFLRFRYFDVLLLRDPGLFLFKIVALCLCRAIQTVR